MLQLEGEIKNNQFSRFHLIYGEERYMVRYYKNILVSKLSQPGDEMNCTYFKDQEIEASSIAEAAQILPFFAPQRLLIVEGSHFFSKANNMVDYLDDFPDTTYLIFIEQDVDKRSRLYKWFNKNGCITECKPQPEKLLKQWIAGYLKKSGKSISISSIELLMERVGTDMETLSNELDKLIGYAGDRQTIGPDDIQAISSGLTISKIFDMIDAVAMKEKDKALSLYDNLLANREPPMSILYLFSRHINILLQMKECMNLGLGRNDIAKKCGVPPFTIPKYSRQAKLFKGSQLLQMLENRLKYEEDIKMGRINDQLSVELFLIQALTNS